MAKHTTEITQFLLADMRDNPADVFEQVQKALQAFNLHMYEVPGYDETDAYAVIITNQNYTPAELQQLADEQNA